MRLPQGHFFLAKPFISLQSLLRSGFLNEAGRLPYLLLQQVPPFALYFLCSIQLLLPSNMPYNVLSYYLYCLKVKGESVSRSVVSSSLQPHGLQSARLLCLWNSPGKNTRMGSHSFLQGIFLTQELNQGLLHCRQILYHLSHQRSPHLYCFSECLSH